MPTRQKRNALRIIDRPLQLSIAFTAAGLIIGSGVLCVAGALVVPQFKIPDGLSGETVSNILVVTHTAYFVLAAGAVAVISILLTHRVAGPSRCLRQAIERMTAGDYEGRLKIRQKDFLQELSTALQDLRTELLARDAAVEETRAALERGDFEAAMSALPGHQAHADCERVAG